jgi:hypothetical protein
MAGFWSNFVVWGYFFWLANASWTSPLSYLLLAFWAWMIYDAIKNDPERIWLWVVLILGPLGAVVYFLFRKAPTLNLPKPAFLARWGRRKELWAAEAAARNIGNPYQFVALGDLQRELGEPQQAAASYQKALAKEPKNLQALWGLALTEYESHSYADARERLATIVSIDPNFKFGEAFLAYGRTLVALGEKDAAREHLAGGIKRWSYPEAYVLLAGLLIERGESAEARKLLESVVVDMRAGPEFNQRRNRRWVRQAQRMLSRLGRA